MLLWFGQESPNLQNLYYTVLIVQIMEIFPNRNIMFSSGFCTYHLKAHLLQISYYIYSTDLNLNLATEQEAYADLSRGLAQSYIHIILYKFT